jgi:hypothetical protein
MGNIAVPVHVCGRILLDWWIRIFEKLPANRKPENHYQEPLLAGKALLRMLSSSIIVGLGDRFGLFL